MRLELEKDEAHLLYRAAIRGLLGTNHIEADEPLKQGLLYKLNQLATDVLEDELAQR